MASRVTVVGLGPGDPLLRTIAAQQALDAAGSIVLRTRIHPGLDDLATDPRVTDCDDIYERAVSFDDVYVAIAERVCEVALTADGAVVFAVPGHPRFGERSVRLVEERATGLGIVVEVQAGVSALDTIAGALGIDPLADDVQLIDAFSLVAAVEREPFAGGLVAVDPSRPCLIGQVYTPRVAASVKLALARFYPDDHPVVVVRAAGVPGGDDLVPCPLHELDRQPVDHLTSVWLPALPPLNAYRHPQTLRRIVARLRAPGGCPWDRRQSHASLRQAVVEEAYETVDAIEAGDVENLAEELGDLLLQVALHAQIAEEAGDFAFEDVCEQVSRKLIRRHPHVFGTVEARTPEEVVTTWEAIKAEERATANGDDPPPRHPLDRLPRSMPALRRAATLLGPRKGDLPSDPDSGPVEEAGEALLQVVEETVRAGVDPERALERALRRRLTEGAPDGSPEGQGPRSSGGKVPA